MPFYEGFHLTDVQLIHRSNVIKESPTFCRHIFKCPSREVSVCWDVSIKRFHYIFKRFKHLPQILDLLIVISLIANQKMYEKSKTRNRGALEDRKNE